MPSFAVITPTIGTKYLAKCIESVRGQDCVHYIVMDGEEHFDKITNILKTVGFTDQQKLISLQKNVGRGWYGHRVYAAASFLVNEDYLCYLDEDNWVEPNHIESLLKTLNTHQWAFTLRNIVDIDGSFVCQDNCESLGLWQVFGNSGTYHIDTGCFAIPRSLAVKVGHNWYGQWGADRQFFSAVKKFAPNFGCTGTYTLNYRVGGETSSANKEMFLKGNQITQEFYQGAYPWQTQTNQIKKKMLTFNTTTNQFS